ncbi:hypothetical protein [Nocardioides sp. 616]|uniref:hypothetical protein n=1 Tax=Nocardioides sp. 616 TaxID=2268090 RepID=UPI000CE50099|nr:hypothetical protein [Nocardioides sp. 616]
MVINGRSGLLGLDRTFGTMRLDGGDVRLRGPMGEVRCAVSTEHLNRFSSNTAKDFREWEYASQLVGLLHAHGAGVLP